MHWISKLSSRTSLMPRGTVREFLKHAGRPGVISFAGGLPAPELFPVDAIRAANDRLLSRRGASALQYGQTEGVAELREYLAHRFHVGIENVLITSGAQQALDLIGRVLLDPRDLVQVENPTYLSLLSAWRPLGVQFRGVPMDSNGLRVEELAASKLLYLMPNFQNPAGTTLSANRREQLVAVAKDKDVLIVEDDAYGDLRYEGEPLPTLHSLLHGQAVYVGTFSKVLAPGFRVGWIIAPSELTDAFVRAKQAMDLHTSTLNQHLVLELIKDGTLESQLPILRREYKLRREAMLNALQTFMPGGCAWNKPAGGMFLLLRLPEGVRGQRVAQAALDRNLLVVPGDDFHLTGGSNTLRLNFTHSPPDLLARGIKILSEVVRAHLQELGGSSVEGASKCSRNGEK